MLRRKSLALVAAAVLPLALISSSANADTASAAAVGVTVDYAADAGPANHVASGFLHGIDAQDPAQYLIDGVDVHSIRGADYHQNLPSLYDANTYRRVSATGANIQVGVYYYRTRPGHPNRGYWPGDGGDYNTWRRIVTDVYTEAQQKNYKMGSWITWNEPDIQWGDFNRYMRAHDVAYDTLKSLNPNARVQAPEFARFDYPKLTQFLSYCKANNCLPDVLAWHELTDSPTDVPGHVRQINQWMRDNGINPMPITITEYQGTGYGNSNAWHTGKNVRWLAQFERAAQEGLESALYSAWEWVGEDSRFRASLGNAADRATVSLPRAVWWNYHAYKNMTGRMVRTTSAAPTTVDALAAVDTGLHRSVALVGNQTSSTQQVNLQLANVPAALVRDGAIRVRVKTATNSETLTATTTAVDRDVSIVAGGATVGLSLPAGGSARVDVLPATDQTPGIHLEAENLPATATSGVTYRTYAEAGASGGEATALEATANGQSVRYPVNLPETGVYDLRAGLKSLGNRGMAQVYVDGKPVGGPLDEYGSDRYYGTDVGVVRLSAGSHTVEFRVVGKHPSSSGRWYVVDYLKLVPLGSGGGSGGQFTTIVNRNSSKCVDVAAASSANGAAIQQYSCWGGANQQWQLRDAGNSYVEIVARHSGKCLDVPAASTANGAQLQQYSCWGGTNQQWQLRSTGDGYYEIVARHSGKCIDVPASSTANGVQLQQYSCWGGANQQWKL